MISDQTILRRVGSQNFQLQFHFPCKKWFLRQKQSIYACLRNMFFVFLRFFFSRRIIVTTWFDCATVLRIEQQTTWFRQNRRPICFSELVAEKPGDQKSYMNFTSSQTLIIRNAHRNFLNEASRVFAHWEKIYHGSGHTSGCFHYHSQWIPTLQ